MPLYWVLLQWALDDARRADVLIADWLSRPVDGGEARA